MKQLLRGLILGATLFFLGKVFKDNWQQVWSIRLSAMGWASLAIALGVTLLAHICAGWVWSRILREFGQPVPPVWIVQMYLRTNVAKYLPGNVWHYYGRIKAATQAGATPGAATLSVLLEPLLMAAAALLLMVLCTQQVGARYGWLFLVLQWACFAGILASVHPAVLNPLMQFLGRQKLGQQILSKQTSSQQTFGQQKSVEPFFTLEHYPLTAFLGEVGFLILRGVGFLLTAQAVSPIAIDTIPLLLGAFSLAWLLGLVVPGAPGGIGVFEATAIALLDRAIPPAIILSVVALYRLVSVLAEALGAGLAGLDQRSSVGSNQSF